MNIIQKSKVWFTISSILIFLSLWSLAVNYFSVYKWNVLNFWIDFTWWAMMEIRFDDLVEKESLEKSSEILIKDYNPKVQSIWVGSFIVRTKEMTDEVHKKFISELEVKFWKLSEPRFATIWPSVWKTMKKNAFLALAVALVVIIFFIAFSFRNLPEELSSWNFWASAIVALVHDVIITVWAFSIMWIIQWTEIDTLFITAVLTVIWFSVHDSIVVFDRIRENMHKKHAWDDFAQVWEKSLKQTMSRSINTSISTLIPLLSIYILWSDSISMFMLALIIWISIWTYSSIFVATPFLIYISPKWSLGDLKSKKNK